MNEYTKLADITTNFTISRVQIATEGTAAFNNILKISPPGYVAFSKESAGLVLHLFGDSNQKVVIPFQYETQLPSDFEEGDSGLYDLETQSVYIKINEDGVTIKSPSVKIDKDDGLGPREIALVGDQTTAPATIIGTP